jgi:hypothetical protein
MFTYNKDITLETNSEKLSEDIRNLFQNNYELFNLPAFILTIHSSQPIKESIESECLALNKQKNFTK